MNTLQLGHTHSVSTPCNCEILIPRLFCSWYCVTKKKQLILTLLYSWFLLWTIQPVQPTPTLCPLPCRSASTSTMGVNLKVSFTTCSYKNLFKLMHKCVSVLKYWSVYLSAKVILCRWIFFELILFVREPDTFINILNYFVYIFFFYWRNSVIIWLLGFLIFCICFILYIFFSSSTDATCVIICPLGFCSSAYVKIL